MAEQFALALRPDSERTGHSTVSYQETPNDSSWPNAADHRKMTNDFTKI